MLIDGMAKTFHGKGPGRARDILDGRQGYIAALEALAVMVPMAAWITELEWRKVMWAIDYLAASACHIEGYARRCDVASAAGAFWVLASAGRVTPWIASVKSK